MLTPEQVAEIADREKRSSAGPWEWDGRRVVEQDLGEGNEFNHDICECFDIEPEANAEFIAHSKADIAALLADRRELEAENTELKAMLQRVIGSMELREPAANESYRAAVELLGRLETP